MNLPDKLLRPKEAAEFLGVGITKLYEFAKDEKFPKKRMLGEKVGGWWATELKKWANDRAEKMKRQLAS